MVGHISRQLTNVRFTFTTGLLVLIGFTVATLFPACGAGNAPLTIDVITTGPITGWIVDEQGNMVISGPRDHPDRPEERYYNEVNNDQFPQQRETYTAQFEVEAEGPITLTFNIERDSPGGLFPIDLGEATEQRALFLIDAPVGAQVSLTFSTTSDVDELRLVIDQDGDGRRDAELTPIATARGEDLNPGAGPQSAADVDAISETEALVTLRAPSELPESGLVYAIFPGQPDLRAYHEPLRVTDGSLVVFAAYDEEVFLGPFQDVTVLGGIAPDIERDLPSSREPIAVSTTTPGQNILLTFAGTAGQRVELVFSEVEIGYANCCQAQVIVFDPDGQHLMRWTRFGAEGLAFAFTLELPGTYTVHIDPELQHLLSATVTLR